MKGIYRIVNKTNNKSYIGKSQNIEERWQYHISQYCNQKEYDKLLYRAFRKYGVSNFSFEILEELNENYDKISNEREKYWIQYYNSYHYGYNATLGGDGGINKKNLENLLKKKLNILEKNI